MDEGVGRGVELVVVLGERDVETKYSLVCVGFIALRWLGKIGYERLSVIVVVQR
jgi:hypothetical protein